MAFLLQLRTLRRRVQEQLNQVNDEEKQSQTPPSRLSDGTSQLSGNTVTSQTAEEEAAKDEEDFQDVQLPTAKHDPYASIPGITAKTREDGSEYYLVEWEDEHDYQNPSNWSTRKRLKTTLILDWIAFAVTAASSIDTTFAQEASKHFHVSQVAETLAIAMFLFGYSVGALLTSPASELVGRYPIYVGTLVVFAGWLTGAALSPNFAAQIIFRFLAGCLGCAPLTVAGGTISDIWNPKEKTWAFPIFAIIGFGGPTLGTVVGAYIGETKHLNWRWDEWIMVVTTGLVIGTIVLFMEETHAARLLKYKAYYFRKITGDERFQCEQEADQEPMSQVLKTSFGRPFVLAIEPIVLAFTFYMVIIYVVLFTFLDGYQYVFQIPYGISTGLTYTIFIAMFIGIVLACGLVPFIYNITKKQLARDGDSGKGEKINQESRLLFAMIGCVFLPIGLFWMAWTCYSSISIWSPIISSVVIGFSIMTVFLSCYMYIIDSYETFAASALTFVTVVRYLAAGGMTIVGIPFYKNLGPHYTLTILACISAAAVPIPFALWKWGNKLRHNSKYAVTPGS